MIPFVKFSPLFFLLITNSQKKQFNKRNLFKKINFQIKNITNKNKIYEVIMKSKTFYALILLAGTSLIPPSMAMDEDEDGDREVTVFQKKLLIKEIGISEKTLPRPNLDFKTVQLRDNSLIFLDEDGSTIKTFILKGITYRYKVSGPPVRESSNKFFAYLHIDFSDSKKLVVGPVSFDNMAKINSHLSEDWATQYWDKSEKFLLEEAENYLTQNKETALKFLS
jgi:hypothetical protein